MAFEKAYIPYGCYWSTPFARWQGSFQNLHALKFASEMGHRFFEEKQMDPGIFDQLVLGTTVPQLSAFYGTPWLAGMLGAPYITGPMIGQACATGAKCVEVAARGVETGGYGTVLTVTADRCSNGPLLSYPNPQAPGGTLDREAWVLDNFGDDPYARNAMIDTAENVAAKLGITKEQQDEMTLMRDGQYQDALADDRAFQKRYMLAPIEVKDARGRKVVATVEGDEGVFPTTAEGLAKLKPVKPDGTVSFGSQTYPADANCGIVVATRERARELGKDEKVEVRLLSTAEARADKGYMAMAIVPAARRALEAAGVAMEDIVATKTHTPFAVNDIYFCSEMGIEWKDMNNYGCSLIYGHPQGPTGSRGIIELIEELVIKGGGHGLFDGCAAGDTAMALVMKVTVD